MNMRTRNIKWLPLLVAVSLLGAMLVISLQRQARPAGATDTEDALAYLPALILVPTPTPIPVVPPELVRQVPLPEAECPNAVHANPTSGLVYIANTGSDDVSILKNNLFLKNVPTGKRPTDMASVPNSARTYVTNLTNIASRDQIAVFDGENLTTLLPEHFEPHDIIVHPSNGYTYVTDLDSTVRVFQGTTFVTDISLPSAGWVRTIVADPVTGLVYTASWERGIVYVIDGLTLVDQFQAGWGILEMAIDPITGFFYTANSSPSATYPQNISVFHRDDYTVTPITTAERSFDVAVDRANGLAYIVNDAENSVTVVTGRRLIGNAPVGEFPTGVAAHPTSGFVIVTNEGSDTITILRKAQVVRTDSVGSNPYKAAVNPTTGEFYIINRNRSIDYDDTGRPREICNPPSVSIYK